MKADESREETKRLDVICIGRVMIDIIISGLNELPSIGKNIFGERYFVDIGGGAGITSISLSKLGFKVAIVATCGNDRLGKFIHKTFRENEINTSCFHIGDRNPTNISIEMTFPEDRATVSVAKSARDPIKKEVKKLIENSKHLHLVGLTKEKIDLLKFAISKGLTTSVDADIRKRNQKDLLNQSFQFIDFIMPNYSEILGYDRNSSDFRKISSELGGQVRKYCIVKLGNKGSLATDGKYILEKESFPVDIVDTTGAGDAFNAGFLFGFLNSYSIADSLLIGNAMGAISVKNFGGTSGTADIDQLRKFLNNHRINISI